MFFFFVCVFLGFVYKNSFFFSFYQICVAIKKIPGFGICFFLLINMDDLPTDYDVIDSLDEGEDSQPSEAADNAAHEFEEISGRRVELVEHRQAKRLGAIKQEFLIKKN